MYIAFDLLAADLGVNDKSSQAAWVNHILHEELRIWYQTFVVSISPHLTNLVLVLKTCLMTYSVSHRFKVQPTIHPTM